jgi:hypothetical protein
MEHTAKVTYPQLCFVVPTREQTEKQNSAYVRIASYALQLYKITLFSIMYINNKSRNYFLLSKNGTVSYDLDKKLKSNTDTTLDMMFS